MKDVLVTSFVLTVIFSTLVWACTPTKELTEEDRQYAVHCISAWDGAHHELVQKVKSALRDPSSFEHIRTRGSIVRDGVNNIKMEFRAKNGFGGYNVGYALATIDNKTCKLLDWRVSG